MRVARWLRFVVVLVPGLALVAWLALSLATKTGRAWFERDLTARAELAVAAARQDLVEHWGPEARGRIEAVLREIARDERILGAAACLPDGTTLATTPVYPPGLDCPTLLARISGRLRDPDRPWTQTIALPWGEVHVSALWLGERGAPIGLAVVVHDFGAMSRLERQMRQAVLIGFSALVVGGWLVLALATRLSRRHWFDEVRRLLHTGEQRAEFQPLLQDVRELIDQLAEGRQAPWTAARLKDTLRTRLHGDSVIVVANREPYIHQRSDDGRVGIQHPASGLVTALEPVMRACSGVWVAHGSGSADRETADAKGRLRVPPGEESYTLRRVWLTAEEEQGYYYGFANEHLWPLCHVAHTRPVFRTSDWQHYQRVNAKFADAVAEEATADDQVVLVQDYHFALLPRLVRDRLPRAALLTFWHIPWPNAERMAMSPWRHELIEGLLGSGILGFHTQQHCNNFVDGVDRFFEARIDRERFAIIYNNRTTLVRPYPISIEWPSRWAALVPDAPACRASVIAEHQLRNDALIGVGVDRLDYTKGIEERVLAVERLLEQHPALVGRFVFIQLAAPSRSVIDAYRDIAARVEEHATRVNERFGSRTYRPIVLRRSHHEPIEVFRYYRAADVCYVSSVHDGMNLVAKEFVAAREDERGVLMLSSFTGASRELTEALVVNPYDLDEASDAMAAALAMSADEQRARMHAMRGLLAHFNVYRWAGRMLADAARLREQERLGTRLQAWRSGPAGAA